MSGSFSLSLFSPAKINTFFRVLKKRDDGFHDIASLMLALSFGDLIHVSLGKEDKLTYTGMQIPVDESNLVFRALEVFRSYTGWRQSIHFHLEKKIPVGSGLGGGSSNAATALWALRQLSCLPLSQKELQALGTEIGSDVPFFFSQGAALCEGRGEKIKDLDFVFKPSLYLVVDDLHVSTPKVYAHCRPHAISEEPPQSLLASVIQGDFPMVNDLEAAAFAAYPQLCKRKQILQKYFAKVLMTGSGSGFFCLDKLSKPPAGLSCIKVKAIRRKKEHWYAP